MLACGLLRGSFVPPKEIAHLRDLTRELGVGTCCGKCLPEAKAALSASLDSRESPLDAYFPQTGTEFAV